MGVQLALPLAGSISRGGMSTDLMAFGDGVGMPSNNEEKTPKEKAPPSRDSEFREMLEQYAADLRAIMDKLRRQLN